MKKCLEVLEIVSIQIRHSFVSIVQTCVLENNAIVAYKVTYQLLISAPKSRNNVPLTRIVLMEDSAKVTIASVSTILHLLYVKIVYLNLYYIMKTVPYHVPTMIVFMESVLRVFVSAKKDILINIVHSITVLQLFSVRVIIMVNVYLDHVHVFLTQLSI